MKFLKRGVFFQWKKERLEGEFGKSIRSNPMGPDGRGRARHTGITHTHTHCRTALITLLHRRESLSNKAKRNRFTSDDRQFKSCTFASAKILESLDSVLL